MPQGKKVLVILDSDHSKKHVLEEINIYGPMVTVGSYMIVQDTNINGHPVYPEFGPGPWEALDEFLSSNRQFQSDKNCERLMFTMHPRGYPEESRVMPKPSLRADSRRSSSLLPMRQYLNQAFRSNPRGGLTITTFPRTAPRSTGTRQP